MHDAKRSNGFTLIELLVIVAVIGILSAIAIQQFTSYQKRGYDAQAHSDLRNAVTAEEAYFATAQLYKTGTDAAPGSSSFLDGLRISPTVTLVMTANGSAGFSGTAHSSKGSRTLAYDSTIGAIQ
ncbi:MAG: prepilin-type N-terminal cleavage/methylation domain-containing protein [Deltaproteobacteria bacterium]|nr:prepilin-type N-terminal cleavage/methylation domain-containing protein [Deltaproteobacteria bacterium]MBI3390440.1 prepilin-type N-terminal cleavage/methylation domain-containing protein [Deltaproteobacteria bacterium]